MFGKQRSRLAPSPSKNVFTVEATDLAGNKSAGTQIEIKNIKRAKVLMVKDSAGIVVDGNPQMLPEKVVVSSNIFMAPFDFVEFLGGTKQSNLSGKGGTLQVSINGFTLVMTIGSDNATLNDKAIKLVSAPYIQGSTIFVPVVDVAGRLGCGTFVETDKLTITYDKLP